jgi:hypothetical protein
VHALRHVHQLLIAGGTMLDLHPVTEEHAEDARGRHIGVLADPEYADEDLPNAEARLEEAVAAGLYVPEAEVEFDMLQHYDNAGELIEAKAERLDSQQELLQQIRAATPPLRLREHVVLRRYRAA